jgi:beta-phosphoglucomutase-like phosphatase (HAD superfamily)
VVGIEDSAAGVIAIRLAGFAAVGVAGGNIEASGVRGLCSYYCHSLSEVGELLL